MIERVNVIGSGRVGSAVSARLQERGLQLDDADPGLVLLCVPDRSIGEAAAYVAPGPWVAHVSGATPLAALAPHVRRFSVHPLQTFTRAPRPRAARRRLGRRHGRERRGARCRDLARRDARPAARSRSPTRIAPTYHAGAAIASNYLVTLRQAAGSLLEAAGAPPEALDPLMRRTIENGFELTGPIQRGDWETVERAPRGDPGGPARARGDLPRPRRCHGGRRMRTCRTIAESGRRSSRAATARSASSRRWARCTPATSRCFEAARAECSTVVMSLFVNPAQFGEPADLAPYPRDEAHDLAAAAEAGVDLVFAPTVEEMYPPGFQTWVDVTELGSVLEGAHRPGHFRGVATVCLKLFTIVRPDIVYFGQKDAQQVAVLRRLIARPRARARAARRCRPSATTDGLALSSRNAAALAARARAARSSLPQALATRDPERARELLDGLEVDYVEIAAVRPARPRRRRPRRLHPPDRQRPPRGGTAMSTRPRTPAPGAPRRPASSRSPSCSG